MTQYNIELVQTLHRIDNDVRVCKTPMFRKHTSIKQTINDKESTILIMDNEIDDLISVLQEYQDRLRDYEE